MPVRRTVRALIVVIVLTGEALCSGRFRLSKSLHRLNYRGIRSAASTQRAGRTSHSGVCNTVGGRRPGCGLEDQQTLSGPYRGEETGSIGGRPLRSEQTEGRKRLTDDALTVYTERLDTSAAGRKRWLRKFLGLSLTESVP